MQGVVLRTLGWNRDIGQFTLCVSDIAKLTMPIKAGPIAGLSYAGSG